MKVKIDLERDNNLTPFGIATVQDRYLDKNETSPQHAFARASKYVSTYRGKTDWEMAQRIYDYASNLWFGFSKRARTIVVNKDIFIEGSSSPSLTYEDLFLKL